MPYLERTNAIQRYPVKNMKNLHLRKSDAGLPLVALPSYFHLQNVLNERLSFSNTWVNIARQNSFTVLSRRPPLPNQPTSPQACRTRWWPAAEG